MTARVNTLTPASTDSAPASSADNGKFDDFVIASTIPEMQRDARAKAARASYEF